MQNELAIAARDDACVNPAAPVAALLGLAELSPWAASLFASSSGGEKRTVTAKRRRRTTT